MTLPNVLGLGAQRAGTTWLDKILRQHAELYLPGQRKEVHYFDRYYQRGSDWYAAYFPPPSVATEYKWIGEITPAYLYDPCVPARISETLTDCRFIVNLRNPVDRAFSQYCYNVRNSNDPRNFFEFIEQEDDVLARGLYAEQLDRYFALFDRERFLILVFEDFTVSPCKAMEEISRFLDIDPQGFDTNTAMKRPNASSQVRFPRTYAKARRTMQWFRGHDLDWVANAMKKMAGQRWPAAENERSPIPSRMGRSHRFTSAASTSIASL